MTVTIGVRPSSRPPPEPESLGLCMQFSRYRLPSQVDKIHVEKRIKKKKYLENNRASVLEEHNGIYVDQASSLQGR